ncbi:Nodule Cysteine-Rich (NCR) secreted peptide [Medicago truncatula]|uniref:Nodule Cysteine-Rich (NCR) secreted peptide n=2 Tax=Medicago truncatula TaxID=3880 RepID=A0A072UBT3_MEDTR|nr:Nodule Cysteine-Rich (NCR) secreted peptide [Medicago truncatula]
MFVYSLIIFFSLFFGEAAIERTEPMLTTYLILCVSEADCPKVVKPNYTMCAGGICWQSVQGSNQGP